MSASRDRRLELLFDMGRLLSSKLDLSELLKTVLALSAELVDAQTASLLLLDEASQELYFDVALGLDASLASVRLKLGQGIAGSVAKARRAEIIADTRRDPRWSGAMDEKTGFVTRSILAAPILLKGKLLGVVEAINKREGDFDDEDLRAFEAFASQAAVAIDNARLFASLSDERFKLDAVFSQMHDGAVLTDAAGKVLLANSAAARLLGAPPRDFVSRLGGLETSPPMPALLTDARESVPFAAVRREPTLFVLSGRSTRAPLQGGTARLFVFRDDTEAWRQERLKRTFLSLVSHKLKTPVAVALGFSDLLLSDMDPRKSDPAKYRAVKTIRDQTAKVGGLLEKLLRFVAVDDPDAAASPAEVSIDEAVAEALNGLPRAAERGARVSAPPCGLRLRADKALLIEALRELLDNAIKFDPAPAPEISVSARRADGLVEISVADRGPGIPPEAREAVFSRFHQVEKDFTGQQDGIGLGLALARRIAELHGGTLLLNSQLGAGTAAALRLPEDGPA